MKEVPIKTIATIREKKGNHNFTASLPNGKIIMVHTPKKLNFLVEELSDGDLVEVEMTPFDFDKGRIMSKKN